MFRSLRYSLSPMQQAVKNAAAQDRLGLVEVVDWLVEDKLVDPALAEQLKKGRRYYKGSSHPLVVLADQKWKYLAPPHRPVSLESLTEWLAKRVGMDYVHIDPLKIDFTAVTDTMPSGSAPRFRTLPIGVSTKEAIIATAEPHARAW